MERTYEPANIHNVEKGTPVYVVGGYSYGRPPSSKYSPGVVTRVGKNCFWATCEKRGESRFTARGKQWGNSFSRHAFRCILRSDASDADLAKRDAEHEHAERLGDLKRKAQAAIPKCESVEVLESILVMLDK